MITAKHVEAVPHSHARMLLMKAINSQSWLSAVTFLLPLCPFHPFCLLWVCSFPTGGPLVVLLRRHSFACRPRAKTSITRWKSSMIETGHTQKSGKLRPQASVSSTHLVPSAFSPDNTKWVEKALGKTSAAHNLTAEKYSLFSKKRKGKWVKQCEQLFKGQWVGMPQLFIFKLYLTTVMKWVLWTGWLRHREAEPTGSQHPPQPCLDESLWG